MKKYLIIAIFLFGCNTAQRQLSKTQEYLFKHPDFTAGVCAEKFPDKPDSVIVITDTIINIATMDSLVYDTLLMRHDSLLLRTIVKTQKIYIRKDSIIYRENKAESQRLQLALNDCQTNNNTLLKSNQDKDLIIAEWKGKAKKRWLWIALLIGGAAAFTAFKIFKPKIFNI